MNRWFAGLICAGTLVAGVTTLAANAQPVSPAPSASPMSSMAPEATAAPMGTMAPMASASPMSTMKP